MTPKEGFIAIRNLVNKSFHRAQDRFLEICKGSANYLFLDELSSQNLVREALQRDFKWDSGNVEFNLHSECDWIVEKFNIKSSFLERVQMEQMQEFLVSLLRCAWLFTIYRGDCVIDWGPNFVQPSDRLHPKCDVDSTKVTAHIWPAVMIQNKERQRRRVWAGHLVADEQGRPVTVTLESLAQEYSRIRDEGYMACFFALLNTKTSSELITAIRNIVNTLTSQQSGRDFEEDMRSIEKKVRLCILENSTARDFCFRLWNWAAKFKLFDQGLFSSEKIHKLEFDGAFHIRHPNADEKDSKIREVYFPGLFIAGKVIEKISVWTGNLFIGKDAWHFVEPQLHVMRTRISQKRSPVRVQFVPLARMWCKNLLLKNAFDIIQEGLPVKNSQGQCAKFQVYPKWNDENFAQVIISMGDAQKKIDLRDNPPRSNPGQTKPLDFELQVSIDLKRQLVVINWIKHVSTWNRSAVPSSVRFDELLDL
eukprot:TRINITY_DN3041_c0_g3_i1.p1 TRINITY_DN3041_c0_g3~~TRINITY_DN3041_c0_g3_i1.p1  ORF type:complete len:551 (+),score=112.96 TRINITY_DN3041_c0_g3_i1:222-1655(+)